MASGVGSVLQLDTMFRALPTTREARWDLLKQFFAGWYGALLPGDGCSPEAIRAAEQRLQVALPTAMCEWYALAGRRKAVWSCQDHFLEPEKLRTENDKLIICIENQAAVKWAIPLKSLTLDDPPVVVSDQRDPEHWIEETPSVSVFALSQLLLDAKFSDSATFSANGQATDESLVAIARSYQKLDFPDLSWPPHPTRLYGGSDLLIETDAETWVWVSGRRLTTFRPAVDLIADHGVIWEQLIGS
jgi:hypothetical protein